MSLLESAVTRARAEEAARLDPMDVATILDRIVRLADKARKVAVSEPGLEVIAWVAQQLGLMLGSAASVDRGELRRRHSVALRVLTDIESEGAQLRRAEQIIEGAAKIELAAEAIGYVRRRIAMSFPASNPSDDVILGALDVYRRPRAGAGPRRKGGTETTAEERQQALAPFSRTLGIVTADDPASAARSLRAQRRAK